MSEQDLTAKRPRPKRDRKEPEPRYEVGDGRKFSKDDQYRLNEAFAITFNRHEAGRVVRDYLKSISINRIKEPGTPPDEINYHEGARWLMAIIERRITDGEEKKP